MEERVPADSKGRAVGEQDVGWLRGLTRPWVSGLALAGHSCGSASPLLVRSFHLCQERSSFQSDPAIWRGLPARLPRGSLKPAAAPARAPAPGARGVQRRGVWQGMRLPAGEGGGESAVVAGEPSLRQERGGGQKG